MKYLNKLDLTDFSCINPDQVLSKLDKRLDDYIKERLILTAELKKDILGQQLSESKSSDKNYRGVKVDYDRYSRILSQTDQVIFHCPYIMLLKRLIRIVILYHLKTGEDLTEEKISACLKRDSWNDNIKAFLTSTLALEDKSQDLQKKDPLLYSLDYWYDVYMAIVRNIGIEKPLRQAAYRVIDGDLITIDQNNMLMVFELKIIK